MPTKRQLLTRRKAAGNTQKITSTMERVSMAYLHRAQTAVVNSRPYRQALARTMRVLAAAGGEKVAHPLLAVREPARSAAVVVLGSDRGLCGSFNANIAVRAQKLLGRLAAEDCKAQVTVVGKKVGRMLEHTGAVTSVLSGISHKPGFSHADDLAGGLMSRYTAGEIDALILVYSEFRSMLNQEVKETRLLPLAPSVSDAGEAGAAGPADVIFHPEPERILAQVLPMMIKNLMFNAMLESAAGEHAARRLAMKNATDAAEDMITMLTRRYNRTRQSMITQEIAEIVGGVEALE